MPRKIEQSLDHHPSPAQTLRTVEIGQVDDELLFLHNGRVHRVRDRRLVSLARGKTGNDGRIRASMTGKVVALHAVVGTFIEAGQPVITIEAMKMEHTHIAPISGVLSQVMAELNQQVSAHRVVAEIIPAASEATGGNAGREVVS